MEKKATRRIIGVLVVVALIIILLPLFNSTDSQSNLQTAEIKAPPFPDSQNDNSPASTDTTVAQNNNAPSMRSWFSKIMSSQAEPSTGPDKTIVTAQSTIQPTISDDPNNAEANAGTKTPPKQDTLIANSSDVEEDVEQGTVNNNVTVTDTPTANKAPNTAATQTAPTPATPTQSSAAQPTQVPVPVPVPAPAPASAPVKPIASEDSMDNAIKAAPAFEKPTNAPAIAPVMSKNSEPLSKTIADVNKIAETAQLTMPPAPTEIEKKKIDAVALNTKTPAATVSDKKNVTQTALNKTSPAPVEAGKMKITETAQNKTTPATVKAGKMKVTETAQNKATPVTVQAGKMKVTETAQNKATPATVKAGEMKITETAQNKSTPATVKAGKMKVTETAQNTPAPTVKVIEKKKAIQTSQTTPTPSTTVNIEQLKKAAWVVQIGSFKSKNNAENLTNALRAKGFKAFTFATKSNGQTRVYIGPEFKQSSALALAGKVQSDLNMRGIVVPFKPLEL
jgi:DedD protein